MHSERIKMKQPKSKLLKNSTKILSDNIFVIFFLTFFFINLFFTLIFITKTRGEAFSNLFFLPTISVKDHFMDFFNSIRDAGGKDVYDKRIIYPPLANMIFYFFARFFPEDLVAVDFDNRLLIRDNQTGLMLYLIISLICILILFITLRKYLDSSAYKKSGTILAAVLSMAYPVIYCFERGNILILSVLGTAFFVLFYDSENKILREISFISLAIAAGIKLYPAIFGILLLREKKFKEAARLILYGIIFAFLPFFFYDGFESIKTLISNLSLFDDKKASFIIGSVSIENFMRHYDIGTDSSRTVVFVIFEIIAIVASFVLKKKWQRALALTCAMLNIHSASTFYAVSFLIIPFIMFLVEERENRKDILNWLYLFVFSIMFSYIPSFFILSSEDKQFAFLMKTGLSFRYACQLQLFSSMILFLILFFLLFLELIFTVYSLMSNKLKK